MEISLYLIFESSNSMQPKIDLSETQNQKLRAKGLVEIKNHVRKNTRRT